MKIMMKQIYSKENKELEIDYLEPTEEEVEERVEETKRLEETGDWDKIPSNEGIKMYLHEIAQYPLLSQEEEREVAKAARGGDEEAQEKLVCANLRLVVNLAKESMGRGVEFEDLIQAGNNGLLLAVKKFDANKGYRFATYAGWWIKEGIKKVINEESRTVRLPDHIIDEVNYLKKAISDLSRVLERSPRDEEVMRYTDGKFKKEKFEMLMRLAKNGDATTSLDAYIGDEEKTTIGDIINDEAQDVERTAQEIDKRKVIEIALGSLQPELRRVVELRYGLNEKEEIYTLDETAKILYKEGIKAKKGDRALSKEMIRQMEVRAIRQLRENEKLKEIMKGVSI